MHAYLLVGKNDLSGYTPLESHSIETIAEVRAFIKLLQYAPATHTYFHLTGIDNAKSEAQNALLKTLEEPPINTTLILTAQNEHAIVGTILSRVTIIKGAQQLPDDSVSPELSFAAISKITDRDEAKSYVKGIIKHAKDTQIKESALEALVALNKNGSVTLQLTNLVLRALPR